MSSLSCDRAVLVEAMFDGRLGPSEQAAAERHLRGCTACTEVLRELTSLQEILRGAPNPISQLEHQRARFALLRQSAAPSSTKRRRPAALLGAALLLLPVGVWAATSSFSPLHFADKTPAHNAPSKSEKSVNRRKHVASVPAAVAPATTSEVDTTSAAPSALSDTTARPDRQASSSTKSSLRRTRAEPRARRTWLGPATDAAQASQDFAEAMQALSRGDFSTSASELHGFASAHPRDPRVEEAIYLEAIALQRAGRSTDAKTAAVRYLAGYPDGAHSAHARQIAGD